MKLPRMFAALLCTAILTGFGSTMAAEYSPGLDAELASKSDAELITAIIVLESPLDIQALDAKLHAERAPLARRHQEVIAALKYNAETTQPAINAELDAARQIGDVTGYTAYWIENLFVLQATKSYLESLRPRGDIKYGMENLVAELIEPIRSSGPERDVRNPLDSRFVPPGIRAVGALRVNEELGFTGSGVLVANLDTGVDGNHPALAARWRGLTEPWQECWRDALGTNTTFPNDGNGHGTHVMGTMTGRAVSGTDTTWVGCAPAARWIANNAINQGVSGAFDNDIIDAFQWFADPDANPATLDDVPDVIQNSWGVNTSLGYPTCFDFWNTVILNCEAAGPVVTWSAGNEGTSGLRSPAKYSINATQIFAVGAVDASGYPNEPYPIASFSSRGPTNCTPAIPNTIKPEICAPGVNVYSSVPGGGYSGTYSGTSMSGPHVAGVVALMREACPDCDPTTIKEAIMATATDYGTAGDDNTYGMGFINAYNAVLAVTLDFGRVIGTVRDAGTLAPLPAVVEVVGGSQRTTCNASGYYTMLLPGDSTYTIRYSLYGYNMQEVLVTIATDDTTTQDVNLVARPVVTRFFDDFESGGTGWVHSSPGGWVDQWHISTERYFSAGHSFKCGDTGTGSYANLCDAQLTSPPIDNLPSDARLRFLHQIESELSGAFPDSAYDGGMIELSVNGGAFTQVTPVGGYNKTFRWRAGGSNPYTGPVPGARCFAGNVTPWAEVAVDLSAYEGQSVRVRFRFGSDAGTAAEGWYIDDVRVTGFGPNELPAPIEVTIFTDGTDIILRWQSNGSPFYRVYSDTDPEGPFGTFVGQSATAELTLPGAVNAEKRFYIVRSWDGVN